MLAPLNAILFFLFLAVVLWTLLRRGKRMAALAMRGIAAQQGGIYRSANLFSQGSVILSNQGQTVQVKLSSCTWLGTEFVATFQGPWIGQRPQIPLARPTQSEFCQRRSSPSPPPGTLPVLLATDLNQIAQQLENFSVVREANVWTKGNSFFSQAILSSASVPQAVHWFELVNRLYLLLNAETEAGIQFAASPPAAASVAASPIAICQVCGLPPEPTEVVFCRACGAPHHSDCWEYNRGCAIYGCREKQPR